VADQSEETAATARSETEGGDMRAAETLTASVPEPSSAPEPSTAAAAGARNPIRTALASAGSRLSDNLSDPATMLALVLVAAFVSRVAWLNLPAGGLIFDESYYVNAARILLGWVVPGEAHYAGSALGLDPNTEHPPLGKLLMALSMLVFGDNGIGWRVPSVVAGMLALWAMYRIVRTSGETARFGVLVVAILAFDNLTLVHGRIGTLDMMALAPILVGSWLAMRRHWALAGLAVAIGCLVKITAIYGVAAVLLLYLLEVGVPWWRAKRIPLRDLRGPLIFCLTFVVVSLGGLGLLDARFSKYANPIDHVEHMLSYGTRLERPVGATGFCPGADSQPWQWIFNECQIAYLRVDVTVKSGDTVISSRPSIDFRGALNPLLSSMIVLAALFTAWYAWRTRARVALWAVAWGVANYLPFVALALLTERIMYIYYLLPAIPAIATAIALLVTRARLPRVVRIGFLVAYAIGIAAYYPFRQIP
jgi:dolichyl-phosphate-mannose-protein mannosyltransferase